MTREEFRLYLLEPKIDQACASPEHDTNIPHKRKDSRREDLGIEYLLAQVIQERIPRKSMVSVEAVPRGRAGEIATASL